MLIGYQDSETLKATGIKRGGYVLIPKGTKVHSTHPSKSDYFTKKDNKVKVYVVGCGTDISINDYGYQDFIDAYSEKAGAMCLLGFDNDGNILPRGLKATLPMHNPSITWFGTGGYYCSVDINDVIVIKE